MLPTSASAMAALLQQQSRQQQSHSNGVTVTVPESNALIVEEMSRRKAALAGTPYSITMQFPWRLHELLEIVEKEGLEQIVSFLPDGCSFKVHDPARFESGLMRRCFNQTVRTRHTKNQLVYFLCTNCTLGNSFTIAF